MKKDTVEDIIANMSDSDEEEKPYETEMTPIVQQNHQSIMKQLFQEVNTLTKQLKTLNQKTSDIDLDDILEKCLHSLENESKKFEPVAVQFQHLFQDMSKFFQNEMIDDVKKNI